MLGQLLKGDITDNLNMAKYSDPTINSSIAETHRVCFRSLVVVVDGGGGRRGGAERDPVLGRRRCQPPPAPVGVRRRERHLSGCRELPAAIKKRSTCYLSDSIMLN